MPILVYRAIKEAHRGTPLSTLGSEKVAGRWHPAGIPVLYTATTPELAMLEIRAHLPGLLRVPKLFIAEIEIPDDLRVYRSDDPSLPAGPPAWNDPRLNYTLPNVPTHLFLKSWLDKPDVLAIGVPSVPMQISTNYIVHGNHPLFNQVKVIQLIELSTDPRLWE